MPKIFHEPHKNPPAPSPTYLMYSPLLQIGEKNWTERVLRTKIDGSFKGVRYFELQYNNCKIPCILKCYFVHKTLL